MEKPNKGLYKKFIKAIAFKRLIKIQEYIDKGVDINYNDNNALRLAAEGGELKIVKLLVENGSDIHANNDKALKTASLAGKLNIVEYLIQEGTYTSEVKDIALRHASFKGHLDIVKYLVSEGADIQAGGNKPLKLASEHGHLNMVKYLIEEGADINASDGFVLRAAIQYGHVDVVKYLLSKGAIIHSEYGALKFATNRGQLKIVKYLESINDNIFIAETGNKVLIYVIELDIILNRWSEYSFSKFDFDGCEDFKDNCLFFKSLNEELRLSFKRSIDKHPDLVSIITNNDILKVMKDVDTVELLLDVGIELSNSKLIDILMMNNSKVNTLLKEYGYLDNLKEDIIEIVNLTDNRELLSLI